MNSWLEYLYAALIGGPLVAIGLFSAYWVISTPFRRWWAFNKAMDNMFKISFKGPWL